MGIVHKVKVRFSVCHLENICPINLVCQNYVSLTIKKAANFCTEQKHSVNYLTSFLISYISLPNETLCNILQLPESLDWHMNFFWGRRIFAAASAVINFIELGCPGWIELLKHRRGQRRFRIGSIFLPSCDAAPPFGCPALSMGRRDLGERSESS